MTQLSMDNPFTSKLEQALNPHMVRDFYDEDRNMMDQFESLRARYYDDARPYYSYGRYWHGYRTFLRLLGSVFTYAQLRIVNYICMGLLLIAACYYVYRLLDRSFALIFFLSLFAVSIYLVPLSLQYVSVFYVLLVSVIALCVLLKKYADRAPVPELFSLSAIAVVYLDFGTSPLVILGFLLVLYNVWLYRQRDTSGKRVLRRSAGLGLIWFVSYYGFWAAKWLVAQLAGIEGVFSDATGTMALHLGGYGSIIGYAPYAILSNIATLMGATSLSVSMRSGSYWLSIFAFVLLIGSAIILWLLLLKRIQGKLDLSICRRYVPLLAIAALPFVWWETNPWHSAHHIFVYRENAVFIFALVAFFIITYREARFKRNQ